MWSLLWLARKSAGQQKRGGGKLHLLKLVWKHQNSDRRDPIPPHPSMGRSVFATVILMDLGYQSTPSPPPSFPHLRLEARWCLNLHGSHWGYHFSFLTAGVCIARVRSKEALSKPRVDWLSGQLNPCLSGIATNTKVREFFFFKGTLK